MSYLRVKQWQITRKTLEDIIAAHLYATSIVNDNDEVSKIEILWEKEIMGMIPIDVTLKREDKKKSNNGT